MSRVARSASAHVEPYSSALLGDEAGKPALDITTAEAEVLPDAKALRSLAVVSPCVDRLHRDVEIPGKFLGGKETLRAVHGLFIEWQGLSVMANHGIMYHSGIDSTKQA